MNLKYYLRGLGLGIIVTAIIMGLSANSREHLSDDEIRERAKQLGMVESTVLTESGKDALAEDDAQEAKDTAKEINLEVLKSEETDENTTVQDDKSQKDSDASAVVERPKTNTSNQQEAISEGENTDKVADEKSSVDASKNADKKIEETADEKQKQEKVLEKNTAEEIKAEDNVAAEDNSKVEEVTQAEEMKNDATQKTTYSLQIVSGDSSYSVAKKLAAAGIVPSAQALDNYLCQHGYDRHISTGTYEITSDMSEEEIGRIINRR